MKSSVRLRWAKLLLSGLIVLQIIWLWVFVNHLVCAGQDVSILGEYSLRALLSLPLLYLLYSPLFGTARSVRLCAYIIALMGLEPYLRDMLWPGSVLQSGLSGLMIALAALLTSLLSINAKADMP